MIGRIRVSVIKYLHRPRHFEQNEIPLFSEANSKRYRGLFLACDGEALTPAFVTNSCHPPKLEISRAVCCLGLDQKAPHPTPSVGDDLAGQALGDDSIGPLEADFGA
jgi:hypothetical protein